MKTLMLIICFIALFKAEAQTKDEKWNVGLHGGLTQYNGDLGQGWFALDQAVYGFGGVSVSRYLSKRFDLSVLLTRGQLGYMGNYNSEMRENNFRINLGSANVLARFHLVSREAVFAPYVFAGGSVITQKYLETVKQNVRSNDVDLAFPTGGLGFLIRFGPYLSLQLQEMLMYTWADDIDHLASGGKDIYLFHTIGLTWNISKKEKMRNWNTVND